MGNKSHKGQSKMTSQMKQERTLPPSRRLTATPDSEDDGLIEGLLKTYEESEPRFADFAIHCQNDEIVLCHKILLVLRSGYFDGLLRMEPETKSVSLSEYPVDVVKSVVKSAIAVDPEELKEVGLVEVLRLADFLQMEHLIKAVSPLISEMIDITTIYNIYNLARSSYFPDLVQDAEHFIKENVLDLRMEFLTEISEELLVKFFNTFTRPQTLKVGEHGWLLDKVEVSELLVEKLISVLEEKDQVPKIRELVTQCFDRSVLYFIFTRDQDLFEGHHGQTAFFSESNLPNERYNQLIEYKKEFMGDYLKRSEVQKLLKFPQKFAWQGKCYHWQGSYGTAEDIRPNNIMQSEEFNFEGIIRKIGIKTRFWDDRKVVQGFRITSADGTTKAYGMSLHDGRSVEEFEIPPGQHVQSVILRSGWYIDTFGVVTNTGSRFKVGGSGGAERQMNRGNNDNVLFGISGRVVTTQNDPCICHLKFKFITNN